MDLINHHPNAPMQGPGQQPGLSISGLNETWMKWILFTCFFQDSHQLQTNQISQISMPFSDMQPDLETSVIFEFSYDQHDCFLNLDK